ncbi:MAG TPA: outer membrane protein assembly factor BamA [Thermodesulfovibrionales bacterium]|nr:outer membrane protein assembly factor BamA [Thermodesulfovibrionales bacterium]
MEGLRAVKIYQKFFIVLLIIFTSWTVYAQELPIVNSIEIRGLKRIEENAVKSKITQKSGDSISQEKVNEDIKNIYKMGYFDDVRAEIEPFEGGIKLIYVVKEKPTIVRIEFQGNTTFNDAKLGEKATITTGSIADAVLIQDNASKLRAFYEEEGYWLSSIVPILKRISPEEVSLTYQIEEGPKIKIKKILAEGNKTISTKSIKKVMDTKEWWIFSFITSSGYYKKDRMDQDVEKIRDLYFDNGYIKVAVGEPKIKLTDNKKGMVITIPISEGDQFKISSVQFSGNKVFSDDVIKGKINQLPNMPFSKGQLRKDILSISELYSENGYAVATITPDLIPDESKKLVEVHLKIDEGDRYKIGKIEISGNIKTRDKVIRREVRLDEGDIFNSKLLKRSYERINNLNFFETVDIIPKPQPEEKLVDLDIKVKERPTGMLSIGGGYSSVDKLIGMVDLTQGNLFGRGQLLKIRGEFGGRTTYYELTFKDPWFMDKPIAFSASIYKSLRDYIQYSKKATGFGFSFGKDFSEYVKGEVEYNFEDATIYNVSKDASIVITDQKGTNTTSRITPFLVRDSRDNYLDPSKGSRNSIYLTYAGIGGTNNFVKSEIDSAWFFPLGKTAFMLRGRFGYAAGIWGKELPLYERFYIGGIYTIRGLGWGEAGPRDPKTGDPIGGTTELIFNAEYIFPIVSELRFKGVVFFDTGNSYDSFDKFGSLRYTTGAGIRWISPMGPIRVEWGYNLNKRKDEKSSRIEFTFGTFF